MALIKCTDAGGIVKSAVVLDFDDLNLQARQVLADAHARAETLLREARATAAQEQQAAAARGLAEGREQGLAEGRETGRLEARAAVLADLGPRAEAVVEGWSSALEAWRRDREDMLLAARQEVLAFAIAFAEKVVHRTVELDERVITDQLRAALSLVMEPSAVEVRIHPDDRRAADMILPELLSALGADAHATLRDDPSLARGGCVVRTRAGRIDATIDTQVRRLTDALRPRPEGQGGGGRRGGDEAASVDEGAGS